MNCQKGFQTILGILTLFSSVKGFLDYRDKCFNSFESGSYTRTTDAGLSIEVENADWIGGPGFRCIMACFIGASYVIKVMGSLLVIIL